MFCCFRVTSHQNKIIDNSSWDYCTYINCPISGNHICTPPTVYCICYLSELVSTNNLITLKFISFSWSLFLSHLFFRNVNYSGSILQSFRALLAPHSCLSPIGFIFSPSFSFLLSFDFREFQICLSWVDLYASSDDVPFKMTSPSLHIWHSWSPLQMTHR